MRTPKRPAAPLHMSGGVLLALLAACDQPPAGPDSAPSGPGDLTPPVVADGAPLEPEVAAAIRAGLEALRAAPGEARARRELGMVYESNSFFELAERAYSQATLLDTEDARAWYHAARMRRELGDLDGAREALARTLALAPEYAPAARRSGEWWLSDGEFAAAERDFERAARAAPQLPGGALGLARTALARGDAAAAETRARAVLAAHPGTLYAWHVLGGALRDLGRPAEAEAALARAAGGPPVWSDPWVDEAESLVSGFNLRMIEVRTLLELGAHEAALEKLGALLDAHPDDVTVQGMTTAALIGLKRHDEALALLSAARERQPDHFRIELNLALVHLRGGDPRTGMAHLRRSLELHPDFASAHLLLGRTLADEGDAAGAVRAFEDALRCGADPRRALPRLGRSQVALERWADAQATYARAALLLPDDPSIQAYLGGTRAELGDRAGAREALERARTLQPSASLLRMIEARLAQLEGGE